MSHAMVADRRTHPYGGDEELRILKKDLEAVGHQVARVTKLNNKKNELSLAVRICLKATVLPEEI